MQAISFFSFKGGVGRTNLLLNIAYGLARGGDFVVIADWDLHAPGLTTMDRLFRPVPDDAQRTFRGTRISARGCSTTSRPSSNPMLSPWIPPRWRSRPA